MAEELKKEWYVVNCYAGHEHAVKDSLLRRAETMGQSNNLFRIVIAEETEEYLDKRGKKKERSNNLFPGYLFVEMIMTDDAWYVVRNTPGVTGLLGSSGGGAKPFPVNPLEIESLLQRMGMSEAKISINYDKGDRVRILRGAFKDVEGTIDSLDMDAQVATVLTILFGRETPTEIGFADLEKVD